jgi:ABC-type lipoprotein release transport system permease subunit
LNPHIVIQPNSFIIDDEYISKLKNKFPDINISKSFSGEGIIINNDNAKGVIFKGINKNEKKSIEFLNKNLTSGNVKAFNKNQFL